MTEPADLRWQTDAGSASWLDLGEDEWQRTVGFGPAGFPAYAKLPLLPDLTPAGSGVLDDDGARDLHTVQRAVEALTTWTATRDDAFFLLWDGWGEPRGDRRLPTLHGHARSYHILRGPLAALQSWGRWDADVPHQEPPAFVWPADRAWCLACDVDPCWAGIGGSVATVNALLQAPDLDVAPVERH